LEAELKGLIADLTGKKSEIFLYGDEEAQATFGIHDYISTGSYELNRIIGGSLFRGIPEKRVSVFAGDEAVGKSLFCLCLAREAIAKGYIVLYIDTENALTAGFCESVGVDMDKLLYAQMSILENVQFMILDVIKKKAERGLIDKKLLVIIDSYGGLIANKFAKDIAAGEDKSDMGIFAKKAKVMFKSVGEKMSRHNVTMVLTNHTVADTSGYVPIEVQTGGKGIRLFPSNIIYLRKKIVKNDDKLGVGINIIAQNVKSRIVPPYQTADIYLDWETGLEPTSGLFPLLIKSGLVEKSGTGWYVYPGDETKKRQKQIIEDLANDNVQGGILDQLENWIQSTGYKSISPLPEDVKEAIATEGVLEEVEEILDESNAG